MPPHVRRRQAVNEDESPAPTNTQRRRRDDPQEDDEDVDMEDDEPDRGSGSLEQLSKGLVRYALSCEFSRKPIKRQDISEKVLGSHTRMFKHVFYQANAELMDVFGVQMVELPKAERVTMRQKRAAAASDSQSKTSAIWVLQTILPAQYRTAEIIGPSKPLQENEGNKEDAYVGLYTMVIALITIAGGIMAEGKLDRAFRRLNLDHSTLLGNKDKILAPMIKDGYIVRIKDTSGGEETIDYIVGPRGKVEVGGEGFKEFVVMMYGDEEDQSELEKRIERTLNVAEALNNNSSSNTSPGPGASQTVGRKRGRPRGGEDEDE